MSKQKQTDRLFSYLVEKKRITPLDTWRDIGIYRLSARIHDLKREGISIEKKMIPIINQFGETVRIAEYRLQS